MLEPTIATATEADEVGRILGEGFGTDPVMTWVFRDPGLADKLRTFFTFIAREAIVPLGATWLVPGGCACWTPPDSPEWPQEREHRFGELLGQIAAPDELSRLGALDAAMRAHHPAERHWYLGDLAATPAVRGTGVGTALLRASLRRVDADGLPAYLESSNPRNLTLYERHGFVRTGTTIDLPDGPSLIPMRRDPVEQP